jgi:hypothetical protein
VEPVLEKTEVKKFRWTVSLIWSHEFRITIGVWCYLLEYCISLCPGPLTSVPLTSGTDLTSSSLPVFEARPGPFLSLHEPLFYMADRPRGGGGVRSIKRLSPFYHLLLLNRKVKEDPLGPIPCCSIKLKNIKMAV